MFDKYRSFYFYGSCCLSSLLFFPDLVALVTEVKGTFKMQII